MTKPKVIQMQLEDGVDDFSRMMYLLLDNGMVEEWGRINDGTWILNKNIRRDTGMTQNNSLES